MFSLFRERERKTHRHTYIHTYKSSNKKKKIIVVCKKYLGKFLLCRVKDNDLLLITEDNRGVLAGVANDGIENPLGFGQTALTKDWHVLRLENPLNNYQPRKRITK